ncbi:MAG: PqqD family protein [Actinomycetia bacterium]|nr:PqqD family protein [Actinomycetes bacterium]MCP4962361.1 PqqD family protein [Actinomycetes bacterium]
MKPKANPSLEVIASDGGFVIHDSASGVVHYLNETAAIVFALCDGELDANDIAELMKRSYRLEAAPVADVETAIAELLRLGVVDV